MAAISKGKRVHYLDDKKDEIVLSAEAKADLEALFEKYGDICTNADSLAEPLRSIAKFVTEEGSRVHDKRRFGTEN